MSAPGAFLTDMKEIRRRAATEIVCVLRYKYHAVCATGLASEAVKEEFVQHAKEEGEHLDLLAERIRATHASALRSYSSKPRAGCPSCP
jgi:ferritin-like protein